MDDAVVLEDWREKVGRDTGISAWAVGGYVGSEAKQVQNSMSAYDNWQEGRQIIDSHLADVLEYITPSFEVGRGVGVDLKEQERRMKICPMCGCDDCRDWQRLTEFLLAKE
jgi:hypothetical protein